MAFVRNARSNNRIKKGARRLFFYIEKAAIEYGEKNRKNHDIMYFWNQTIGERDEKAGKLFVEDVAGICFSCYDHFYDWWHLLFLFS